MESSQYSARELLRKYRNGTCTPEEKRWVEDWYEKIAGREFSLEEDLAEEDLDRVWQRLQKTRQQKPTYHLWKRIAVAASVILVAGLALYIYYPGLHPDNVTAPLANDALPGGNRATLTLSDGSKIDLDEADNGALAEQTGISIRKAADGQLVYEITDSESDRVEVAYNTITTPNGGQYQVVLPDGTKVWLNAASSLRYPVRFEAGQRKVTLRGEGYFEVAHDKAKPFIVESNSQEVTVLGTKFNINAYDNSSAVFTTLIEGSVRLNPAGPADSKVLQPGEQGELIQGQLKIKEVNIEKSIAWKNGQFVFSNTELGVIMQQLERWYDMRVDYRQLPERRFYGRISRDVPLSQVLDMLEETSGMEFTIEGGQIVIK